MRNETMILERKEGKAYRETFRTEETETIHHRLMNDLIAKKLNECRYITKISYRCNYDGTRTITVNYDNNSRALFTVIG